MNYSLKFKNSLKEYVNNMELSKDISNTINRGIKTYGDKVTGTFYRGQPPTNIKIYSKYWFSTSTSRDVAQNMFAGNNGIVYMIHVIDEYAISVNNILTCDDIGDHCQENEIIIEGEGMFYNSDECLIEGFSKINDNLYETWYSTQIIKDVQEKEEEEKEEKQKEKQKERQEIDIELFRKNNMDELQMVDNLEEFRLVFTEFRNKPNEFITKIYNSSMNVECNA